MQIWNVLHVDRWKYRTQKIRQKFAIWAPSHNFVGLYLYNEATFRQSQKNLLNSYISSTCPHNMANFGPLTAEISSGVRGNPANFNSFRMLASLLQRRRSPEGRPTKRCTMLGRLLGCYTIYTFRGLLRPNGILPGAKCTLRPSLAFSYIGSVTARHSAAAGVSQTLRRRADGATCVRQGGHHVRHRPTF